MRYGGFSAGGRLARLTVFAAVVTGIVVGAGMPAGAVDTTPPTLVSFARNSATPMSPGQNLSLSWSASDASGVSSVTFHYTDILGNDKAFTGSGSSGTLTSTVLTSWVPGTYRLDEIDVVDAAANKAKYIAGTTSFNLDTADFTVNGAPPQKPTIRGVLDRTQLPAAAWQPVVNGYVLRANWADLQTTQGGAITANNAIDQAIAQLRILNAQNRGVHAPMRLKLRVLAGDSAPDWAKNVGGPPVSVQDAQNASTYDTVGRFWTPAFGAAYQDFMTKLAARYDGVPEVRDVVVSRCTLTTAEPFIRMMNDTTTVANLRAAGFTVAADHTCHQEQVDVHKAVWLHTTSSVAFTPYQQITPTTTSLDETWTETMIGYCRSQLGNRCVLESNSIKDPSQPRGSFYPQMYAKIASMGPPIAYQTASPNNGLGSLCNTLGWAVSQRTGAVELPQSYVRDGLSTPAGMASYDRALEADSNTDTSAPTVPGSFRGTVSGATVSLSWANSSDTGYGVACYSISKNGVFQATTMNTTWTDATATLTGPATYSLVALDGAGNKSGAASTTVSPPATTTTTRPPPTTVATTTTSTTRPPPTTVATTTTSTTRPPTTTTVKATAPSAPQGLTVTNQCTGALLKWAAPASNGGAAITAYKIYRGGWGAETYLATVNGSALSYNDTTGGAYTYNYYRVTAVNAGGIEGPPSSNVGGYKTC